MASIATRQRRTFALFFLAVYTRLVRVRMLEVMEEPYIRAAAPKGASGGRIVRSHALRNALGPVSTLVGMDIGVVLVIVAVNFAIDLAVAWMDPRATAAGTRRSALGRIA